MKDKLLDLINNSNNTIYIENIYGVKVIVFDLTNISNKMINQINDMNLVDILIENKIMYLKQLKHLQKFFKIVPDKKILELLTIESDEEFKLYARKVKLKELND